jgi:hypothetical protein
MRGLLPYFFSVALVVWLIGGTVWYQKHYCQVTLKTKETAIAPLDKEKHTVKLATPFSIADSDSPPVYSGESISEINKVEAEELNLYFNENKFRFALTKELHDYFINLKQYLQQNPNVIITVKSFVNSTEGVKISRKRLNSFHAFFTENRFQKQQIMYESGGISRLDTTRNPLKNQRIEIRFIKP